jgi:imidazolonepropionase-like amidohydrolase
MRIDRISFLLLYISLSVFAQQPPLKPGNLLLQHANVIDGISTEPRMNVDILIRDGKIVQIGKGPFEVAAVRAIDLHGSWVLPGLIDAHIESNETHRFVTPSGSSMLAHYL